LCVAQALINTGHLSRFATFSETIEKAGYGPQKKVAPVALAEFKVDEGTEEAEIALSLSEEYD
jgi:hypothetical protein